MPQMAPISWLLLFIMFSLIFILFNIMNYYSFFTLSPKSSMVSKNMTPSLTWKW
uniref:ATP synthase complex subunit 8 n=1 Tax=Clusiodes albimanus TaxID=576318 RepID=A0A7D7ATV0_9MUSC|nr:ATP synthase F0 subunit 8 [Clusiodes albimanus]